MKPYIINTITSWNEPPRARHQVAHALSRRAHVIFIEANKFGLPGIKRIKVSEQLEVLSPIFPIDFRVRYRLPVINELYQRWLFNQLGKIYPNAKVINFDFSAYLLPNFFKNIIYYCNDQFIPKKPVGFKRLLYKYRKSIESKLIRRVRFCIGTSNYQVAHLAKNNPKSYLIRLGGPNLQEEGYCPSFHQNHHQTIRVGYLGYISPGNIDISIINRLTNDPKIHLTMIGPHKKLKMQEFARPERIHWKPPQTGLNLYRIVDSFDVAIIPYPFQQKIDRTPNKLWIYLAMGKPVVTTNIQSLQKISVPKGFIYRANNDKEFIRQVKRAHKENSPESFHSRVELAREHTWDRKIDNLLQIYSQNDKTLNNSPNVHTKINL